MTKKKDDFNSRKPNHQSILPWTLTGIVLIAIWTLFVAPEFKKIPNDFAYSADVLSLDNFFDEKTGKFEGEHISRTQFNYSVVEETPYYLLIKNSFHVNKLSAKPIIAVDRNYYIDAYSGQHVANHEQKRNGYLFAPRYASKDSFTYWHINYDAPALMHFVGAEKIEGLTVYHYQAKYEADQTPDLTHLPGVPEEKGIKADINLQVWVEPISGWLVKYSDTTSAYYYDIKNGKKLRHWNSFSNRYTQRSINEKVKEATQLKRKILFIDFGVPLLIIFGCLIISFRKDLNDLFYSLYLNTLGKIQWPVKSALIIAIVLLAVLPFFLVLEYKTIQKPRIGISHWSNNPELLSALQGFKDGLAENGFYEGINVDFIIQNPESNVEKQISIIQSFIRAKVNLIFTLTTPGTLIAKGVTTTIPIVFTDVSYPISAGIVPAHNLIKSNLVGTLNYISPAEQFYRFELIFPTVRNLGFVYKKGDPDSEIQLQEFISLLTKRGIKVLPIAAIDIEDMQIQLNQKVQNHEINAIFFACDTLIRDKGFKTAALLSKQYKIPSFSCDKGSIAEGVLVGYFADLYTTGKLAGYKAALLLQGAETSWLKTEATEKGVLMINIPTAKALNLTIPFDELDSNRTLVEY